MSSHREAPEISKDPVADNTDVYAFVSPDRPNTVTLIANFIPLQQPGGGPELLRVRLGCRLSHPHLEPRRRARGHHLLVQVRNPGTQPQHVPLQHRTDHQDRRCNVEPAAVLLRDAMGARQAPPARVASRGSPP